MISSGRALFSDQTVPHGDFRTADNVKIVLFHQVVHGEHGSRGGVLDGQNAVFAQPLFHRVEYTLKILKIGDRRNGKDLFRGDPAVCALHALTGDRSGNGKRPLFFQRLFEGADDRGRTRDKRALIGLARIEQRRKDLFCVDLDLFRHVCGHAVDDLLFPAGNGDGSAVLRLFLADFPADRHAGGVQSGDFVVDRVDFPSVIFQFTHCFLLK